MAQHPHSFNVTTAREMIEKARRELTRFEADPCADHAMNFFISIHHARDYAKREGLPINEIDSDPDFELCRLASNEAKHLVLTGQTLEVAVVREFESHNDVAYGGDEAFAILADGKRISVANVGRRVLGAWDRFLTATAPLLRTSAESTNS
jgi:hypothetical protein